MAAAAELVAGLDARGLTTPAGLENAITGVAESRWVGPAQLVGAAAAARDAGFFYESMTCVDRLNPHEFFELIITFNRWDKAARVAIRVAVPRGSSAPTLTGLYPIAEWNEREAWEFYGLEFEGHPNLTWLLLPEGTEFRPLLKSFTAPPPSEYDRTIGAAGDDA